MTTQNRCLIFVEGSGRTNSSIDWESLLSNVAGFQEATLLWMTDSPYDSLMSFITKKNITVKLVETAPLLQREMQSFHVELKTWLENLNKDMSDIPDRWLSRVFEPNFSETPWFDLVRFNVLEAELSSGCYKSCISVSSYSINRLAEQLCRFLKIDFYGHPENRPKVLSINPCFLIRCWFRNFRADFISWLITRNVSKEQKVDYLVYARYPNNWSKGLMAYYYRFTGSLSSAMSASGETASYLVTISRRNSSSLKSVKTLFSDWKTLQTFNSDMPFVPVESFGNLFSMLSSYFILKDSVKWLLRWRKLIKSEKLKWRNTDISFLFTGKIFSTILLDWPSTRYLEKCVENVLRINRVKSLIVPIFELVEGRAVVRAGNRNHVKTIGIQHGSAGHAHRWRVMTPAAVMASERKKDFQCAPDIIAVEGSLPERWLSESGCPQSSFFISGAPRLTKKIVSLPQVEIKRNILILGDMHRPDTLFRWALKGLSDTGFKLIMRPHPATFKRTVAWLKNEPENLKVHARISSNAVSLDEELQTSCPVCLLAGCTGAAVDVALSGWPVIIILSNWLPDYSPLTADENCGILSSGSSSVVKSWIERLHDDPSFRIEYGRTCCQAAENLIDPTGDEAVSRLVEIL